MGQVDPEVPHPPPYSNSDFSADLHWSQRWQKIREKNAEFRGSAEDFTACNMVFPKTKESILIPPVADRH